MARIEPIVCARLSQDGGRRVDPSPLSIASENGHVEVVNLLIQAKAEIKATDKVRSARQGFDSMKLKFNFCCDFSRVLFCENPRIGVGPGE